MIRRTLPLMSAAVIFAISGYVVQVALARQLGPVDYGVVGLVVSVLSLANVIQASGVPQAMAKRASELDDRADDVLATGLKLQAAISLLLLATVLALSPLLSAVFREPELVTYFLVGVLMLPGFGTMTALSGYWNGVHRFGRQARLIIAYALSKVVLVVGLAYAYGPLGALAGYAIAPLVGLVTGFHRPRSGRSIAARPLAALSVPMVGFAVTTLALYSVDLYLVKVFVSGDAAVGHYVAAQSVAVLPVLTVSAFNQVLLPRVSSLMGKADVEGAARSVEQGLRQVLLLLLPGIAVISAGSSEIVVLLYGTEYEPAGSALRYLVVAIGLVAMLSVFANALSGAGHARTAVRCSAIGLAVTVVAGWVLIPILSLTGAALSVGLGALAAAVLAAHRLRQSVPITLSRNRAARLVGSAVVAFGIGSLPLSSGVLVVQLLVAFLLGIGFALATGELTLEERDRMRGLVRAGFSRNGRN